MITRSTILGLLVAVVAGCGGDGKPAIGTVTGTVTLDGQPVAKGGVVFLPASGRMARGKIENGEIVDVTTFDTGDGVIVGPAQVAVQAAVLMDNPKKIPGFMGRQAKRGEAGYVPPRYGNLSSSGLSAEIEKGKNELTLELTSS